MSGGDDWCTIESDPGVFTSMLEDLGVEGVELQELWSLDDDSLAQLGSQVYGLIFLFQWQNDDKNNNGPNDSADERKPLDEDAIPPNLFFAHQVTTNACATQAILSVLFNTQQLVQEQEDENETDKVSLGPTLSEFRSFTAEFPPLLKGEAIRSSEEIKKIHNSFSRQDAFMTEGKVHIPTGDEEAFHFVAYVPVNNVVYELDGLQSGPIVVGDVVVPDANAMDDDDKDGPPSSMIPSWISVARRAIQNRMQTMGEAAIKFNLMAVTQDARIAARMQGDAVALSEMEAKRHQWKVENERRRHNYVPLCITLLQELAKLGQLTSLQQEAQERVAAKRAAKKG